MSLVKFLRATKRSEGESLPNLDRRSFCSGHVRLVGHPARFDGCPSVRPSGLPSGVLFPGCGVWYYGTARTIHTRAGRAAVAPQRHIIVTVHSSPHTHAHKLTVVIDKYPPRELLATATVSYDYAVYNT